MYDCLTVLLKNSKVQDFHTKRVSSPPRDFRIPIDHNMSMFYDSFSNVIMVNACEPTLLSETEYFVDYIFRENLVKIIIESRTQSDYIKSRTIFTVNYDCTEEELFQLDTVQNTYGLTLEHIKMFRRIRSHYIEDL